MNQSNPIWRASLTTAIWLAMPIAVFTCSGWLGLAVHCLAFSGVASILTGSIRERNHQFGQLQGLEGERSCAPVNSERA